MKWAVVNVLLVTTLISVLTLCEVTDAQQPNMNDSDEWEKEKVPLNEAIPRMNMTFATKCWSATVKKAGEEESWYDAPSWYTYCMHNEYKKIWNQIKDSKGKVL